MLMSIEFAQRVVVSVKCTCIKQMSAIKISLACAVVFLNNINANSITLTNYDSNV